MFRFVLWFQFTHFTRGDTQFLISSFTNSTFQSTHPTQGDTAILHENLLSYSYSITKNSSAFLTYCPKLSNFLVLTEKSDSYLGENPPHFSCELPVRTIIILATYNHLLPSYCITSFVYHTFTVPNRLNTLSIKYTVANICKICPEVI